MDDLCEVYADAYGHVPGKDSVVKTAAFRDRATTALDARNYELVGARADGELVGFVFGYSLRQERDWFAGLNPPPRSPLRALVNGLFVCAENSGASSLIANRGAIGL